MSKHLNVQKIKNVINTQTQLKCLDIIYKTNMKRLWVNFLGFPFALFIVDSELASGNANIRSRQKEVPTKPCSF